MQIDIFKTLIARLLKIPAEKRIDAWFPIDNKRNERVFTFRLLSI